MNNLPFGFYLSCFSFSLLPSLRRHFIFPISFYLIFSCSLLLPFLFLFFSSCFSLLFCLSLPLFLSSDFLLFTLVFLSFLAYSPFCFLVFPVLSFFCVTELPSLLSSFSFFFILSLLCSLFPSFRFWFYLRFLCFLSLRSCSFRFPVRSLILFPISRFLDILCLLFLPNWSSLLSSFFHHLLFASSCTRPPLLIPVPNCLPFFCSLPQSCPILPSFFSPFVPGVVLPGLDSSFYLYYQDVVLMKLLTPASSRSEPPNTQILTLCSTVLTHITSNCWVRLA